MAAREKARAELGDDVELGEPVLAEEAGVLFLGEGKVVSVVSGRTMTFSD